MVHMQVICKVHAKVLMTSIPCGCILLGRSHQYNTTLTMPVVFSLSCLKVFGSGNTFLNETVMQPLCSGVICF